MYEQLIGQKFQPSYDDEAIIYKKAVASLQQLKA